MLYSKLGYGLKVGHSHKFSKQHMDTKEAGQKGGNKTLKVHGPEHFRKIAKKRWAKKPKIKK